MELSTRSSAHGAQHTKTLIITSHSILDGLQTSPCRIRDLVKIPPSKLDGFGVWTKPLPLTENYEILQKLLLQPVTAGTLGWVWQLGIGL